jgi:diazepam-binding inhibitor (GABA receptor modulating acyl-CoA-binding protein)
MADELELKNKFNNSAELIKTCKRELTNDEKLSLYGLYKQSTVGDINTSCPSMVFDYAGYKKWTSWKQNEGKPKSVAMSEYVHVVETIMK